MIEKFFNSRQLKVLLQARKLQNKPPPRLWSTNLLEKEFPTIFTTNQTKRMKPQHPARLIATIWRLETLLASCRNSVIRKSSSHRFTSWNRKSANLIRRNLKWFAPSNSIRPKLAQQEQERARKLRKTSAPRLCGIRYRKKKFN